MTSSNLQSNKECKCKLIPWSISATTAAEYGDLTSLTHRLSKHDQNKTIKNSNNGSNNSTTSSLSNSSNTPLHIASQHGHIAITSYLLQRGFNADTGSTEDTIVKDFVAMATPLHRACYSGSIGCIKLLLDHGANDMTIDGSMGDKMTPLHKAVKGGRYLAVALLLEHFKFKSRNMNSNDFAYLKKALEMKDSMDRTTLELAEELQSNGEEEILSVRRWDTVAGGAANWDRCITLLNESHSLVFENNFSTIIENNGASKISTSSICNVIPNVPTLNMKDILSCDCEEDDDEKRCKTAVWEAAYRSWLLSDFVMKSESNISSMNQKKSENIGIDKTCINNEEVLGEVKVYKTSNDIEHNSEMWEEAKHNNKPSLELGQSCAHCTKNTISLFRAKNGTLVCQRCLKVLKKRR